MLPTNRMIADELVKLGYTYSEANKLIWKHWASIVANLIHREEQNHKDIEKCRQSHPRQFDLNSLNKSQKS